MVEPRDRIDESTQAQLRLAKAMERAQLGEDHQLMQQVREKGEQIVTILHGLLRTSRLHHSDNSVFEQPIEEFVAAAKVLYDLIGVVNLVTVEQQVYINDVRVRFAESSEIPVTLTKEMKRHNVGGLTLHAPPTDQDLRSLLACFSQTPAATSPRMALAQALVARGVKQVEVTGIYRYLLSGESSKKQKKDVVNRSDNATRHAWNNAVNERVLNALPLRRMTAEVLELGPGADSFWEPMPNTPNHIAHAMRVNNLSLLLGTAIGLDKAALQDLGVAALLHDVGYAASRETVGNASRLPHVQGHAVVGGRMLAYQRGFHEAKIRRVLVALHHHRDYSTKPGVRPTLFARIVRVAEDYDNFTRADAGNLSPIEALGAVVAGAGTRYDPTLVQALVNCLGAYPPGTHLELDDDRVVRTCSIVREPELFAKPRATVVGEEGGWLPDHPTTIDLATEGKIIKVLRSFTPKKRAYR